MPASSRPASIAVIGGGIVGLTIALALQDRGHAVTIHDADSGTRAGRGHSASWGNAGHIAVEQVEPLASPAALHALPRRLWGQGAALSLPPRDAGAWLPFGLRLLAASTPGRFAAGRAALAALMADAMPAWQALAQRLDAPGLLRQDGHLVVWSDPARAKAGAAGWLGLDTPTARFRPADAGELEEIAALIGRRPAGAIRCIGSGRIVGHAAVFAALHAAFAAAGGRWRDGPARLERTALGHCRVVGSPPDDVVVLAAGIGSRPLAQALGHTVPMIAERGYHLHAAGAHWPAELPPVVFEDHAMIVTRFADGVRASSFVELARPDSPPDPRKWQALRHRIRALNLPFETTHREWMGARPTLPDYLPAIGRSTRAANLVYAFGHQHLGLTLAPTTARIVADLVDGTAPAIDLAPFDLDRFA
ncbi:MULTISPECIES: NAD(P)/FAD-dependent oxidoreductase [unclassified Sphingomonas]|uniref:NAD(P)/FAD-dependent oxidoreductase n=1 Tax=Novosphingobium rhizosphaerae TaxID=1551649 RepID=UPI0015CA4A1B